MRIAPRGSVRANVAIAILLTIVLSWVLSTGVTNYFNYLNFTSLHQEMEKHPDIYREPLPKPRFGIVEFLTGRPPVPRGSRYGLPPDARPRPERPPMDVPPGERGHGQPRMDFELRWSLVRLGIAIGLAALASMWLGRRFTTPLDQLAKGAREYHAGNFSYRIPTNGKDEFSAVAAAMNNMATQVSEHISDLEEDAERRRQFLADVAHELRSPVTTMRTMAGALQDGVAENPERKERAVSALVRTSERLQRLVQDLMELAKLDLHEFPLNVRQVDLCELASAAIQEHEQEAHAAGIVLHPLSASKPAIANVDPDRFTEVLDNLIGNAISYAGEGAEVRVAIEDGSPIRVTVQDTGRGIPKADIPYVLDPFYRADEARTPGDCHSGLGLSIASRLVEVHGGTLTISSDEDKGTTINILLPEN